MGWTTRTLILEFPSTGNWVRCLAWGPHDSSIDSGLACRIQHVVDNSWQCSLAVGHTRGVNKLVFNWPLPHAKRDAKRALGRDHDVVVDAENCIHMSTFEYQRSSGPQRPTHRCAADHLMAVDETEESGLWCILTYRRQHETWIVGGSDAKCAAFWPPVFQSMRTLQAIDCHEPNTYALDALVSRGCPTAT